jgi:hypothetical protein
VTALRPLALLTPLALCAVAALPQAAQARTCTPPKYPGQGYFMTMSVTKTSCAGGKRVALAHHRCRVKRGVKGTCRSTVLGYTCKERRSTIPTEIDARVTCKKRSARVIFTYQQNT